MTTALRSTRGAVQIPIKSNIDDNLLIYNSILYYRL